MRNIYLTFLISSAVALTAVQAIGAEELEYDRSIATAAIKRVQQKLELKLRGSINHDERARLVTIKDLERPANPYERPEMEQPLPDRRKPQSGLTPMVSNEAYPVDTMMTGSIRKNLLPPAMQWDRFDSNGRVLNPYPGD